MIDTFAVARYINGIKNPNKKEYALKYWKYLTQGHPHVSPPEDLSYLTAQAVRLKLTEFAEGKGMLKK